MSSPNNGCIRLANVETSTVTSTSTIPQGAIITRYDIDCTQGGDDGEDYSPSTCSMNIGLAANQQSNVIAGDVPAPSGYNSYPCNNDLSPILAVTGPQPVQVSFKGSPTSGGCQVLVFWEVPTQ